VDTENIRVSTTGIPRVEDSKEDRTCTNEFTFCVCLCVRRERRE